MTKIVVIGAGLAAARLAERLRQRETSRELKITVVGAERHLPYNRVLLSAALTDPRRLGELVFRSARWYRDAAIDVVRATRAVRIDRRAHAVVGSDGRSYPYDKLVLATGANPVLPPIHDIVTPQGKLRSAVTMFRSYDDCRRLLAHATHARRAVVAGGGLLGLEAARGLVSRGLEVDVVHSGPHLLHDRLDSEGGDVLRRHVEAQGIAVHTGLHVSAARPQSGQLRAVKLSDGYLLDCDVVVIACGSRPAVRLAVAAGLGTAGGIVVDDQLRTDDETIHAIGDCAQHRGIEGNQAWTAWAQADVLADVLLGADARYVAGQRVVRLRAAGIDVAAVGEPVATECDDQHGTDVVRLRNPARGSYKRLAFRDNRLVGGVLVGDTDGAAALAAALARPWLPASPAALLLGTAAAAARRESGDASAFPDDTPVFACNGVTAGQLRAATAHAGARDASGALGVVVNETRATTGCGGCAAAVSSIVTAAAAHLAATG